jgi:hypothetical protein
MVSHDLILVPSQGLPPAIIASSGRKARDRIEHFLRAAIDNNNTRNAYGRALGSFFACLEVTRSRAYRKNDQAHVEQKNGAIVRRLVRYGRFEGLAAAKAPLYYHP